MIREEEYPEIIKAFEEYYDELTVTSIYELNARKLIISADRKDGEFMSGSKLYEVDRITGESEVFYPLEGLMEFDMKTRNKCRYFGRYAELNDEIKKDE